MRRVGIPRTIITIRTSFWGDFEVQEMNPEIYMHEFVYVFEFIYVYTHTYVYNI